MSLCGRVKRNRVNVSAAKKWVERVREWKQNEVPF